jgi:flagellar motor switch protein FliN
MEQQPNVLNFSLGTSRNAGDAAGTNEGTSPADSVMISSIDLLKDVPLRVSVELGRTRLLVRDVLSLRNGSVIELDRPAGGMVDLMVNGVLVARGEVVVVDERFGVRISEVLGSVAAETTPK